MVISDDFNQTKEIESVELDFFCLIQLYDNNLTYVRLTLFEIGLRTRTCFLIS